MNTYRATPPKTVADLSDDYTYNLGRLGEIRLPRGRRLAEALKNDPTAPRPIGALIGQGRGKFYTKAQLLEYIASYDDENRLAHSALAAAQGHLEEALAIKNAAEAQALQMQEEHRESFRSAVESAAAQLVSSTLQDIAARCEMPHAQCGVYFLYRDEAVHYIGQSTNVVSRIADHSRNGVQFDSARFMPCGKDELDDWEGFLIRLLKPAGNGRHGGDRRGNIRAPRSKLWDSLCDMSHLLANEQGVNGEC